MARRRPLVSHFWFRMLLHLTVLAALIGGFGASVYAEHFFNRGVAEGTHLTPIPNTDVNPLGVNTLLNEEADPAMVERTLDMIAAGGFTYVRQMFPWYEIEPEPGVYQWAKYDRIVALADARGLQLIARLDKPPRWAREGAPNLDRFPDGPPNDPADYAAFVSAFVSRYRGKVHYIQIWNEPNLEGEWGGQPIDPAAFTSLLKVAYTAAKKADPTITVLMPGLAPTDQKGPSNLSDLLFLQGMYDAGAKDYFDIATAMVYGYGYSPSDRRVGFARNNFSRVIQTREIMVRNGDADKAVWAAEYGWVSLPSDWNGDPSPWGKPVSAETQAEYLYHGYLRAQQEWPWMGVMCIWNFRWPLDPTAPDQVKNPTRGFSIVNYDFSPRPAYTLLSKARAILDRAYTGGYRADSHVIEQDGNWTLAGQGPQAQLVPQQSGATLRIPFSGEQLDLLLAGAGRGFRVTIDGEGRGVAQVSGAASGPRQVTVAGELSDGPHVAEITSLAAQSDSLSLAGFVVARRPTSAWIYPWIDAGLAVLVLINLASLRLALHRYDKERARVRAETAARARERAASETAGEPANGAGEARPRPKRGARTR